LVRRALILAASLWALAASGAHAQGAGVRCRLALVLALDVSSSVDAAEFDLQRKGLAAALDAPEIRHAILSGEMGAVALSVYQWSGFNQQDEALGWIMLRDGAAIDRAVVALAGMERKHARFPTSIGAALGFGATLLRKGPDCTRRVIDVSGDGVNNYRFGPRAAYRHFPFTGVTVNGLVILGDEPGVESYYAREVLHGPGAFLVIAAGYGEFRAAMTRKLYREIGGLLIGRTRTEDMFASRESGMQLPRASAPVLHIQ